jgi:hypothetical protein
VTVTCVDDAPVAVNDNKTVLEDANATAIDVLANDTDVDGGPKTITSATQPTNGTVVVAANGSDLTYKPNGNYCGSDSFTYTLNGGSTATVSVTVTCVNDNPGNISVTNNGPVNEGSPATITVTANDPDGDTLSYEFDCNNDNNFEVGPQAANSAQCTFNDEGTGTYTVNARVTDGNGGTATGSTNVAVKNAIPTIGPLTVTGNSGTACLGSNNTVKLSFSITDPGTDDTHSGTINWGDGTTTPFSGSSVTDAQHSYSAGTYNITVNASDNDGGNAAPRTTTTAQQVSLLYKVSELHDPVNPSTAATMSVFKSGSTVPLKVLITDCNNQPVNGLVPRISFNRINPSTPALGINEALSTQPNDTNFLMRDAGNGQYIYNLNTKTLPDQDATYSATITDSKATSTAPATYGPKVSQTFGIRSK